MAKEEDKAISLQEAINAMQALQDEDVEAYGVLIPECFDGERAIEALKQLKPVGRAEKAGQATKTGHWISMEVSSGRDSWKCSVCGRRARGKLKNLPYCHCGAKMESEG